MIMLCGPALAAVAAPAGSLLLPGAVEQVYANRDHGAIWMADGKATPLARTLLDRLAQARGDGLDPAAYHLTELMPLLEQVPSPTETIRTNPETARRAEVLLTDAFLALGRDLARGRIDPGSLWEKWVPEKNRPDPLPRLQQVLVDLPDAATARPAAADSVVVSALNACRPDRGGYPKLREAMLNLARIARSGGWPTVDRGQLLRPGDRSPRVRQLRTRLTAGGDLVAPALGPSVPWCRGGDPCLYDDLLAHAVRSFQKRHGLAADGIVGPHTLAALNVPAAHRAHQAALNLERMRWLPRKREQRYILVNIPDFTLTLVPGDGSAPLTMPAIVGRKDRPTPVLSGEMKWLVLNPSWTVPQKLARKDLLPKVAADPGYLAERGFRVFADWRPGAAGIDPDAIDWTAVRPRDMAFKFQQQPGPQNPLGRVKFLFPNPFNVYIHDTNHRGLFNSERRCFSSGCVRIAKPEALLEALISSGKAECDSTALAALNDGETMSLGLDEPVPVHFVYLTAWVDGMGALQFRDDCYDYDQMLAANVACDPLAPVPVRSLRETPAPLAIAANSTAAPPAQDHENYQLRTGPVSR